MMMVSKSAGCGRHSKAHALSPEELRNAAKRIRAVATDIDGTLTDARRRVSTVVIEALRAVEETGVPVILASGNVLPIVKALQIFVGVTGPVIAENGGIVEYNGKVERLADKAESKMALDHVLAKHPELHVVQKFTDQWRQTEVAIEESVPIDELRKAVSGFDVKVESTGFAIHIMAKDVSKFRALKVACTMLGISPEDVIAFGDSENDCDMIAGAGLGIAVGNATKEIKDIASYTTRAYYGEGVAEALELSGIIPPRTKG